MVIDEFRIRFYPFESNHAISTNDYLTATAEVSGYSINQNRWAVFSLARVTEINWSISTNKLILNDGVEASLAHLVNGHLSESPEDKHGLGVLLYGIPGTGKTLTAQVLADKHRMPLLSINAESLGSTDEKARRLRDVFDLALRWNAMLFLDEANPFIIGGQNGNRTDRHALVSHFIQEFESSRGILFMTTNLDLSSLDFAVMSRIHRFIKFEAPTAERRLELWIDELAKRNYRFEKEQLQKWAYYEFSGRDVSNLETLIEPITNELRYVISSMLRL